MKHRHFFFHRMDSGIYEIVNVKNGRRYIGSSNRLSFRFLQHRSALRLNRHFNPKLQSAWNRYGEEAFVYRTLELCEEADLEAVEQRWLDLIHTNGERHYNVARYACSGAKGRSPSADTRAKQSAAVKATYAARTAESREAHSEAIKATWTPEVRATTGEKRRAAWAALSEERRNEIRAARKAGREKPEARAKQLAGTRKLFENPDFRAKQAEASRKAAQNPTTRAKHAANLAARNRARWADPEEAAKMIAALQEEAASEKGRQRRANTMAARWADPEEAERMRTAIKAGANKSN